jgi:hypothetical protein
MELNGRRQVGKNGLGEATDGTGLKGGDEENATGGNGKAGNSWESNGRQQVGKERWERNEDGRRERMIGDK